MDYSIIAKGYNELYSEEQIGKLNVIKKYIKINKNDFLLDIGCGTGISTSFFDCNAIGIDSCFEMLRNNAVCGEAENLPFKDKVFDVVLSVTAIHNFNNIRKTINEIKRVSKGRVVITLLKRANRFKEIRELLNKSFKFIEIGSERDIIFISEYR